MKKGKKNDGCNSNTTNQSANMDEEKKKILLEQLDTLCLSADTLKIIILSILLNYYFIYYSKILILDELNNTDCKHCIIDGTKIPKISNVMIIYASGIFLEINYKNFQKANSVQGEKRDTKAINTTYKAFISSMLVFLAAIISRTNIEV